MKATESKDGTASPQIKLASDHLKALGYIRTAGHICEADELGSYARRSVYVNYKWGISVSLTWTEDPTMCGLMAERLEGSRSFDASKHCPKTLRLEDAAVFTSLLAALREDACLRTLPKNIAEQPVSMLRVPTRIRNVLKNANIVTFGKLAALRPSDLLGARNFGAKSIPELQAALAEQGLVWTDEEVKLIEHE